MRGLRSIIDLDGMFTKDKVYRILDRDKISIDTTADYVVIDDGNDEHEMSAAWADKNFEMVGHDD